MAQRFCATCHSFRNEEGGIIKKTKVRRWVCADCAIKSKLRQPPVTADFAPKKPDNEWRYL